MTSKEIEIILTRQLANYLTIPIFIVDPDGELLYYNESAEEILGRPFQETGKMTKEEWATKFKFINELGTPIEPEDNPLVKALFQRRPIHQKVGITGLNNVPHMIEVTCFPIIGQANRFLGAIAYFWEANEN